MALRLRAGAVWVGRGLVDLAYPPVCLWCDAALPLDRPGRLLCEDCCGRLAPEEWGGCRRCGAIQPEGLQRPENCPACRKHPLHFDAALPLGAYAGELRQVVLRTKRVSHESLAKALGQLLADRRGEELAQFRPDVIVPIPMHWWRRLWRGVNNAEILAAELGRRLQKPVEGRLLVRRRPTRPQRDLLLPERFANLRNAFRLRKNVDRTHRVRVSAHGVCGLHCLKDSHVLLVDDILTTGATSSEAARVFKQAGAASVAVAVLARA
ncbi:MAG: phosphoribosyltransferase family protein [Thermoguttaceae bacterium]